MSVLIDKSYNFGFGLVHSIENPSVVFFSRKITPALFIMLIVASILLYIQQSQSHI